MRRSQNKPNVHKYKLRYFNMMGMGEPIRFLLSYGGTEFEDIRFDSSSDEWLTLTPSTPFGHMPTLEVDGIIYSQTVPICRYLAKQYNLLGKSDLDTLSIDSITNGLHDFQKQVTVFFKDHSEISKAERKDHLLNISVPYYLKKLEDLVSDNGGYLHGGELSYADLFFVAIVDSMSATCQFDITQNRPNLKSLREKILALPAIKAWVEKRPNLRY